jgi:protein-S-isoprenylcysteine O-methyltransferase Ste14
MKLPLVDYILVLLQVILFVMFLFDFSWLELTISTWIQSVALGFSGFGLFFSIVALWQLKKSLSPFPTPKSDSELIITGLYKYIRHPIYSGLLLFFFGYAIYSVSLYRLIVSLLLLVLFHVKSRYEEQKLKERFLEYESYQTYTGRFLPSWLILIG